MTNSKYLFSLVLLIFTCNCVKCQQGTVGDYLEPVWTKPLPYNGSISIPKVVKGGVIVGWPENFTVDSQLASSEYSNENQAYFYVKKNRRYLSVYKRNEKIFSARHAGANEGLNVKSGSSFNRILPFYNKESLQFYSSVDTAIVLSIEISEKPTSSIVIAEDCFFFCIGNMLYRYNLYSGEMEYKLDVGIEVSGLEKFQDGLLIWNQRDGLVNLSPRLEKKWAFKPLETKYANVYFFEHEGDIVFSCGTLYRINGEDGKKVWETSDGCSGFSAFIRIQGNLIFSYNKCLARHELPPVLEIFDSATGELLASGWTSEQYPAMDDEFPNDLDMLGVLSFSQTASDEFIYASDGNYLHKYKIIKR